VNNEVTIIFWTKLDADIGFPRCSLWCSLVTINSQIEVEKH